MNYDDKFRILPGLNREERLAKKKEARAARAARAAQELANRRRIEKMRENSCCYCDDEVGAHDAVRVGDHKRACQDCVSKYGKEVIEKYVTVSEIFSRLERCPSCAKRQEISNFSQFWTGRDYKPVCKTCIETCGETELRDILLQHRGTAPIMSGGLPTLGKDR